MKTELDKALCAKYPQIFKDRHADMRTTCMCWGFECGDGWYDLIDILCCLLQWDTDHNGHSQVVATQVKEKYGGLRFYTNATDERQDGLITFAEAQSLRTCDVCGNPGTQNKDGWINTRCNAHKAAVA